MENVWLQRGNGAPVEVHTQEELVRLMVDGYHQVTAPAAAAAAAAPPDKVAGPPAQKEAEK